jgi:hypothetical protein
MYVCVCIYVCMYMCTCACMYTICYEVLLESSWTVIVVTALVKEHEKGGQGQTESVQNTKFNLLTNGSSLLQSSPLCSEYTVFSVSASPGSSW